ncbi:hypothetical protein [Bowmanella dokdonensis]|uniref:Uncharacterized protein n=1 Tax=Bowmanella dokdonensis TaxID=751969 RepID=A0A939DQ00_9ALTE|nr:hypothetical protein [Bowmanella dokdonensis]MBN7826538.1 hypothetical protein [Bowmanella dokdonensis]
MLAHQQLFSLRLVDYLAPESVEIFDSWRFMGRDWCGEAFGATEFLRPREKPEQTHLVNLDLQEMPANQIRALLARLDLALRPGMTEQQVVDQLGVPAKVHDFLPYRKTLDYQIFQPDPYQLSLTLRINDGLSSILLLAEELNK